MHPHSSGHHLHCHQQLSVLVLPDFLSPGSRESVTLFKVRVTRFLNTSVREQYFHMLKLHDLSISLASSGATGQECILSRAIALHAILVGGYNVLWRIADRRRRRKAGGKGKVLLKT